MYMKCTHYSEGSDWEFHFHDVTVLGTVLYGYTWLVPFTVWAGLWWRNRGNQYTLTQLLAVYGYCMAIFIPVVVSQPLCVCMCVCVYVCLCACMCA